MMQNFLTRHPDVLCGFFLSYRTFRKLTAAMLLMLRTQSGRDSHVKKFASQILVLSSLLYNRWYPCIFIYVADCFVIQARFVELKCVFACMGVPPVIHCPTQSDVDQRLHLVHVSLRDRVWVFLALVCPVSSNHMNLSHI